MKLPTIRRLHGGIVSIFVMPLFLVPISALAKDAARMQVGGRTSQPIGHYEYCSREVRDCRRVAFSTIPTWLTKKRWKELVEINLETNSLIRPVTDLEYYGVEEYWTLPNLNSEDIAGDCEDYVLMKRKALMALGWPASSLLPTVVLRPNGDGHAVLTVRTNKGDFILDNLEDEIVSWDHTVYTYLKRVSAAHSGQWEKIIDSRILVGSID